MLKGTPGLKKIKPKIEGNKYYNFSYINLYEKTVYKNNRWQKYMFFHANTYT